MDCVQGGAPTWHAGSNYFWPVDAASAEALDGVWQQLLGGQAEESMLLHLKYGRTLLVLHLHPPVHTTSASFMLLNLPIPRFQAEQI
jgi:hypothetical protein